MGVRTSYTDGLGKRVSVGAPTLVSVCAALGAPIARASDAADALRARPRGRGRGRGTLPPVLVAWDGLLPALAVPRAAARLACEGGEILTPALAGGALALDRPLPFGYHRLTIESARRTAACTVISAPIQSWRRPGDRRSWGVGTQLAALRSSRSGALADLRDLETLCGWVRGKGGDLVTVLPLLPTFNSDPPEPSPYSPVSRLFWSELVLDLGAGQLPAAPPTTLDVTAARAGVWEALASHAPPDAAKLDAELIRYARFRGAQARLGRNWRAWPADARAGALDPHHADATVERFHLLAQTLVREQLRDLRLRLSESGVRLGLDLAVGVNPDGYDPWSRQHLFAEGMSVGAPPDAGFPSGQDWGFTPLLPEASRQEDHQYVRAAIALQAGLAGVLRVDHIMAWSRLYWIPHGMGLHEGTYVSYPAEELFAILTLESQRHQCEIVGENLGTVPREIVEALPRHRIWGMYLAQFEAPKGPHIAPPGGTDVALIGTHDTPTFAGWLAGADIEERVRYRLLAADAAPTAVAARARAARQLAARLGGSVEEPRALLELLLDWLGRSASPLVVPWLEDLWLEPRAVNLPGTRSSDRPNWQRPMGRLLDDILTDPDIDALVRRLGRARHTP